jgi:hypothetical protein
MIIPDSYLLAEVNMINAGIVGLVAIVVIVFAIMSSKQWHWINIVLLVLTLISSITAIAGMSYAYNHRRKGMVEYRNAEKLATQKSVELDKLINGDLLSPRFEPGSLRYIDSALSKSLTGRGRVWQAGRVSAAEGPLRTFTFSAARDLEKEGSLKGAVLYAFAETEIAFPSRYIGAVQVEAESATTLTLKPLALAEVKAYAEPKTTWSLFEKMPQDQRGVFKEMLTARVESNPEIPAVYKQFVEKLKDENAEFDISTFRDILKRDFLPAERLDFDPKSREYELLIDRYAFDGQSIGKIESWIADNAARRIAKRFEPKPDEVFIQYVFTKDSDPQAPMAVDGIGKLETEGIFNAGGQAVAGGLTGTPNGVTFAKGDIAIINLASANGYATEGGRVRGFSEIHEGRIDEQDRIYFRELQDLPFELRDLKIRSERIAEETLRANKANANQRIALEDAAKQTQVRTQLLTSLEEDNENLTADAAAIEASNGRKQQRSAALDQQLRSLQNRIASVYRQIQSRSMQMLRIAVSTQ